MNIRKILTLTALFMLVAIGTKCYAQNTVAIHQKDGKVTTFAFTEKPVVTYSGSDLVLSTTKTTVQYPVYLLKKLVFDVEWTKSVSHIEEIKSSDIAFSFHDGSLTISGGKPSSIVTLYSVKGVKVGQYRLDADGRANIPTQGLGRDIYIVKTNRLSFKFRKP